MTYTASTVIKTYPSRGPLQQFRFATATAFRCFRCGQSKKSKLNSVYRGDWSRKLCNGCYGYLLSIYKIKADTSDDQTKFKQLTDLLVSAINKEEQRQAERLLLASRERANRLSPQSMRFLATTEFLAERLSSVTDIDLEWSPAVIGLCKAVETEVIALLVVPLANATAELDLTCDIKDRDLRPIAAYCADPKRNPPELGTVGHFLRTVIHSRRRRNQSVLMQTFLRLMGDLSGVQWILDPQGLQCELTNLTTSFRNKAAHIDELTKSDYLQCHKQVAGPHGVLWKLATSADSRIKTGTS